MIIITGITCFVIGVVVSTIANKMSISIKNEHIEKLMIRNKQLEEVAYRKSIKVYQDYRG